MSVEEDSLSLKQIISRYESAEEEFLRELETMQQCANTDTSDEFADESPVLGTLCSLVTEISELRKENKKLRRRLSTVTSTSSSVTPRRPGSAVVHRMSTFLDSSRNAIRFLSSSSSGGSLKKGMSALSAEIKSGARERLSSPPPISSNPQKPKAQSTLAISSYSTDLSSDSSTFNRRLNAPPLVLPESWDSDTENRREELPDIDSNCLSPCYPRRSMVRRSQRSPISENTSPSSVSAGSSVEPSDTMKCPFDWASVETLFSAQNSHKSKIHGVRSIAEKRPTDILPQQKHVSKSLRSVCPPTSRQNLRSKLENSEENRKRKIRPKSLAYLSADFPQLQTKTKSWRSVQSEEGPTVDEDEFPHLQMALDDNALLRQEITVLKQRNSQLIDNLREKSMQLSRVQHRMENQMEDVRRREKMNAAVDKLLLRERISRVALDALSGVESRLREFETELQNTKNEALRNQQSVINSTFREQNAYQNCLEQVERLQRENFSLLQTNANDLGPMDRSLREKIELLPRYDALYSFTIRIVRRMGQLRNIAVDKANKLIRAELEVMHQQSALLIAHAQLERMKLEMENRKRTALRRNASFHGEDLLSRVTKPQLKVFLPFKLHGGRIAQSRKSQTNGDFVLEEFEPIEVEFLKFFDSSRFLQQKLNNRLTPTPERERPNPRIDNVIVYRNGRGTVSPMNSPKVERRPFGNSPLAQRKEQKREITESPVFTKRPCSWLDASEPNNSRLVRRALVEEWNSKNASPVLNRLTRKEQFTDAVSSLQNAAASSTVLRSPSTTPILSRRIPLLGSPKLTERRKPQMSPNGSSYDNQPLYDSPPRANGSSDYSSIESHQSSRISRPIGTPNADRRPPKAENSKLIHHHHHHHHPNPNVTRLPQPSTGNPNLRRSNAILRRNSPVLSSEQRPSVLRQNALLAARHARQSASESPRLAPRFQHPGIPASQPIREEEEIDSCNNNTRLPIPSFNGNSPQFGPNKKAGGSSWLKFLLNPKKPN